MFEDVVASPRARIHAPRVSQRLVVGQGRQAAPGVNGGMKQLQWQSKQDLFEFDPPQQAQAAMCVYVGGMSHAEAAEVLEVSRRTVANLFERFNSWAKDYVQANADKGAKSR